MPWLRQSQTAVRPTARSQKRLGNRNCKVNLLKHFHLVESSRPILVYLFALCLFILDTQPRGCPPKIRGAQCSNVICSDETLGPATSFAHSGKLCLRHNTLKQLCSHFKFFLYSIISNHDCLAIE